MESSDPPKLKVTVESGTAQASEFVFENWFRIGRHTHCQIQLISPEVSRHHADVFIDGGAWWIQDLESANGVFVEGRKIDKFQISGTTRVRLGRAGPVLTLAFETAQRWMRRIPMGPMDITGLIPGPSPTTSSTTSAIGKTAPPSASTP